MDVDVDVDGAPATLAAAVAAAAADRGLPAPPFAHALVLEPAFGRLGAHPLACAVAAWRRAAALRPLLRAGAAVFPAAARVCAQAVWLRDLASSHGPVGAVDGFPHAPYDDVARHFAAHTFLYAMRDYEWRAASAPATAWARLSLAAGDAQLPATFAAELELGGGGGGGAPDCAHAVLFWVEFDGGDGEGEPAFSSHPRAAPHARQLLRFLDPPLPLRRADGAANAVRVRLAIGDAARDAAVAVDAPQQAGVCTFDVDAEAVTPPHAAPARG
jgi:hypothetical protein